MEPVPARTLPVQANIKLDLPAIDSPRTPITPTSPLDITIAGSGRDKTEAVSFPECVDPARAVRYCSQSLIEGTWSEETTLRGRRPTFSQQKLS